MDAQDSLIAELKQEVAALRERDQDLSDFIENALLALNWVGADGRILWANQAELELLGYSREEYIGHHIAEFHVEEPVINDILARVMRRETLRNYESRVRCKDGSIRQVAISSNARWDGDTFLHTRCFTRDITESKRYEQRLLTQYDVGRVLAGATSLESAAPQVLEVIAGRLDWRAGLFWEPHENEPALHCAAHWDSTLQNGSSFSARCKQVTLEYGRGLPGRVWSTRQPAWVTDLRRDSNFPRLKLAAEHGLRSAFAFPILRGERVHGVMEFFAEATRFADDELLQMAASLGYQIGEFLERIHAQRELAEREESYRVLTETASDGIITIEAAGTILFANSAAARMFGYTSEELIGSDLTVLMPEPARATYKAAICRYLQGGQERPSYRAIPLAGWHRAGYEVPIEISFGEYARGPGRFFAGIIRDITERKQLDDALRQSAKLESLGVLAGGIAHDFNNLLTGILGNISLALDMVNQADPAREPLENSIEASERAAKLTKELLAYAGKGRFVVEPIDISALVREISALLRSSIAKHVTLRLDLHQALPLVDADVAQLQQLIMNLVINGAEAIPEGRQGVVLVSARPQYADAQYLAALGATEIGPGDYVAINVHDNGVGMDDVTLGKIFDPFFTTKFTGRGLGLAAASGIVRGHKGALKVFSNPGQGTTFRVLLPAAVPARPKAVERGVNSDLAGHGTVLVVDDEPVVRKTAQISLERYGYTVVTAEDGREGVERFRELHSQLRVVLLDMTMPVMNGEEALEHMRGIDSRVPAILSSGYNEVEAIRRFAGKGLAGFLQKPYTAAALAAKIQSVLSEAEDSAAK